MRLRILLGSVVALGLAEAAVHSNHSPDPRASGEARLDTPLLSPAVLADTARIVIREKPQSKVVSNQNGIQVQLVVAPDAPMRETVLVRHGADRWVVANCLDLEVDSAWLGQTMRDLSEGRFVRYVTSDPALAADLQLNLGEVRCEDAGGHVLRRLEFGRKDGGDTYQFVRVDGRDVFVAHHTAEIVGSPTAWIETRLLDCDAADVRSFECTAGIAPAARVVFHRDAPGAPLKNAASAPAPDAEKALARLLAEPAMLAIDRRSPEATGASRHIAAEVDLSLFGGKDYRVTYGVLPKGAPHSDALLNNPVQELAFATIGCSDPHALAARYSERATLVYNRSNTVDALVGLPANSATAARATQP